MHGRPAVVSVLASVFVLGLVLSLVAACGSLGTAKYMVTVTASGMGTVVSSPAGIDCGADCSEAFEEDAMVTLSATAAPGSILVGWTGGGCSGPGPCTVVVTEELTVAPMFAAASTVTVTVAGTGSGTVTSSPGGINCPGDCSEVYATGQMITLTAAASVTAGFSGWSGGCTGTGACIVSTNATANITASFARALTCNTVADVQSCSNGLIPERNLGVLAATACHDQCQMVMAAAGMTTGCWVVATDTNCYCRSGVIGIGGVRPGGSCTAGN